MKERDKGAGTKCTKRYLVNMGMSFIFFGGGNPIWQTYPEALDSNLAHSLAHTVKFGIPFYLRLKSLFNTWE